MKLDDLRREYGGTILDESLLDKSPLVVFESWLKIAIEQDILDAQCFVLSTVDRAGFPDSRVVLLKEIKDNAFVFYTNYSSPKGAQMAAKSHVALNFYWPALSRQVRITGTCGKTSRKESEQYFKTRPIESQISAIVSEQSQQIESRAALESAYEEYRNKHSENIICPENWGGYAIKPNYFEFFQGHPNRLHDRICYKLDGKQWKMCRIAP